jgi:NitT/TauT family transport system substrate-binding protein
MSAKTGKWLRAAGISAAVALAAAGCSSGGGPGTGAASPAQPGPAEKPTLNISVVPAIDSAGFFVAMDQGYFAQQGLTVNYTPATSSETAVVDQMAGKQDITGGNYVSYIEDVVHQHDPLEVIAEASIMGQGSQMIFTPAGSTIRSLSDLAGQTIAVNAPDNIDYLLDVSVLAENGINVDTDHVSFPGQPVPFPAMAQALQNGGQFAAATMPEPFASMAEQDFGMQPLADLNQGATANFPIEGYVVTREWAAKYPNTLKRFLIALEEGQVKADADRTLVEHAFTHIKDPGGSTDPAVAARYGQVSPQIAAVMALNTYPIGVSKTRIQRVADVMRQFGLLDQHFDVSPMIISSSAFNFTPFSLFPGGYEPIPQTPWLLQPPSVLLAAPAGSRETTGTQRGSPGPR